MEVPHLLLAGSYTYDLEDQVLLYKGGRKVDEIDYFVTKAAMDIMIERGDLRPIDQHKEHLQVLHSAVFGSPISMSMLMRGSSFNNALMGFSGVQDNIEITIASPNIDNDVSVTDYFDWYTSSLLPGYRTQRVAWEPRAESTLSDEDSDPEEEEGRVHPAPGTRLMIPSGGHPAPIDYMDIIDRGLAAYNEYVQPTFESLTDRATHFSNNQGSDRRDDPDFAPAA